MRITRDLFPRRKPPVRLPAFVDQSLYYCSGVAFAALIVGVLFGVCLLISGCKFVTRDAEPSATAGKPAAAQVEDARSKSSALFGTIGAQPDASAPVKRLAEVGEHLNGAATPQDYAWAEKIAASEKARAEAVALADRQAAEIKALLDRLAAAPSPEELAKAKERADRTAAELDAFASATARNGIIGAAAVLLCGFLAWQFSNARIFLWGVLASFALNLEPYLVKRISESPALGWVLGALVILGGALVAYETWVEFRKTAAREATAAPVTEAAASSVAPTVTNAATAGCTRLFTKVKAWVAVALLWIRARFGKAAAATPNATAAPKAPAE